MRRLLFSIFILAFSLTGCRNKTGNKSGEIIIFHAGSLSVPFRQMADEYEKRNPGVKILMEPAGSIVCARKITELKKPCDIIASADYFVINKFIVPDYSSWSIRFATNEIVIAFQEKARYADEINSKNWMDILLRDDVTYARSDPESDPCGYRSVLTFKLAEKYYWKPGLADRLQVKNRTFIRPKEVDLVALIESNAVDYMFQYKSVAIQHNLKYIELPDEINLGNPELNNIYNLVSLDVTGSKPGSTMKVKGEYINYSLSVLKDAPNSELAIDFVAFIISKDGMEIFRKNGQDPIVPFSTEQPDLIPYKLKKYLKE
ncbi:MAG: tungstate ABC transporter substrate-binding protein WtpA [Bacteroidia bacterium]|nr:tungstate ABC transporter substrate-binding protein WtpA [Bacteroidia bacterium]